MRGNGKKRGSEYSEADTGKNDNGTLDGEYPGTGDQEASVLASIDVVLMVGHEAEHRATHAELQQRQVTVDLESERPKAELLLGEIVQGQRYAGHGKYEIGGDAPIT